MEMSKLTVCVQGIADQVRDEEYFQFYGVGGKSGYAKKRFP